MNGMGLAGAELHGMIGYNLLASSAWSSTSRSKMTWTQLDFDPPPPDYLDGREKGGAGGLDMIGGIMKMLGGLSAQGNARGGARGFLGLEAEEDNKGVLVKTCSTRGPRARLG
jgi:hypothetical protein